LKVPKRPYPSWQRRHEAVLTWLVEHPAGTLEECARATGYSRSHLSRITCSPDFRRQLGVFRAELERQVLARVMDRLMPAKFDKEDINNLALVR
jgi:AraC-like DNA-binding protein